MWNIYGKFWPRVFIYVDFIGGLTEIVFGYNRHVRVCLYENNSSGLCVCEISNFIRDSVTFGQRDH